MCLGAWLSVVQLEQEGGEEGEGGEAQNDLAEAKLQQPTTSGSDDSDDDSTVCSHVLSVEVTRDRMVISLLVTSKAFYIKLHGPFCWQRRRAGVEGLIEIENPNRVSQKSKKVTHIEIDEQPKQLSRRERYV